MPNASAKTSQPVLQVLDCAKNGRVPANRADIATDVNVNIWQNLGHLCRRCAGITSSVSIQTLTRNGRIGCEHVWLSEPMRFKQRKGG